MCCMVVCIMFWLILPSMSQSTAQLEGMPSCVCFCFSPLLICSVLFIFDACQTGSLAINGCQYEQFVRWHNICVDVGIAVPHCCSHESSGAISHMRVMREEQQALGDEQLQAREDKQWAGDDMTWLLEKRPAEVVIPAEVSQMEHVPSYHHRQHNFPTFLQPHSPLEYMRCLHQGYQWECRSRGKHAVGRRKLLGQASLLSVRAQAVRDKSIIQRSIGISTIYLKMMYSCCMGVLIWMWLWNGLTQLEGC